MFQLSSSNPSLTKNCYIPKITENVQGVENFFIFDDSFIIFLYFELSVLFIFSLDSYIHSLNIVPFCINENLNIMKLLKGESKKKKKS